MSIFVLQGPSVTSSLCVCLLSYSDIIIEREVLMQKYIHLVQIVETEKVAANQLRTQLEDQDTEIERLKGEVLASTLALKTHYLCLFLFLCLYLFSLSVLLCICLFPSLPSLHL